MAESEMVSNCLLVVRAAAQEALATQLQQELAAAKEAATAAAAASAAAVECGLSSMPSQSSILESPRGSTADFSTAPGADGVGLALGAWPAEGLFVKSIDDSLFPPELCIHLV